MRESFFKTRHFSKTLTLVLTLSIMLMMLRGGVGTVVETCSVTLELVDSESGERLPGLVSIVNASGELVDVPELLNRGTGIRNAGMGDQPSIEQWSVLPRAMTITLPRQRLTFSALSGIETETTMREVDLSSLSEARVRLPLRRFSTLASRQMYGGNTHLHLMKMNRDDSERYLREIAPADGLDLLFVSYLERAVADEEYITNRYTLEDLNRLTDQSGVIFANGEEHRNNFTGGKEGFGHVMLLDIPRLILPVSIGPDISKTGDDGIPLDRGIRQAREDGATIIWCHNDYGRESIPQYVKGQIDAVNIFDGGIISSYEDSFYRLLNAGFRVPFSTGTDWFLYDFSRVFIPVEGELTTDNWLAGLKAGRGFITNGPLLDLQVDDAVPGDELRIDGSHTVNIIAKGTGRGDFQTLELIHNGEVIARGSTKAVDGHFTATVKQTLDVSRSGWIALRTPPPSVRNDPARQKERPRNELGRELYSHTSPVYLLVDGQPYRDPSALRSLIAHVEQSLKVIPEQGVFDDDANRESILAIYRQALDDLRKLTAESKE